LANNPAQQLDLIGMGYVYGNPEYYQGDDANERMMAENDFLFNAANKYPNNIKSTLIFRLWLWTKTVKEFLN